MKLERFLTTTVISLLVIGCLLAKPVNARMAAPVTVAQATNLDLAELQSRQIILDALKFPAAVLGSGIGLLLLLNWSPWKQAALNDLKRRVRKRDAARH